MSESQSAAAGTATTTEAVSILDQVVAATKQTEPDRAQDLVKTLVEQALGGTVTFDKNLTRTFDRAIAAIGELAATDARLRVLAADALAVDAAALVPPPRRIVANLPYNIATPLLVGWLRQAGAYEGMTLMFQQEVAERIAAPVGSPAYGRLSVLAQWVCDVALLLRLPPAAFTPPPKVSSAVVGLTPHPAQPPPELFRAMERLTAAAFGQRRKMLRGPLKPLGGEVLLARAEIDPQRRAETLSVAEFDRLARLTLD